VVTDIMTDADTRATFLSLAIDYDRVADQSERLARRQGLNRLPPCVLARAAHEQAGGAQGGCADGRSGSGSLSRAPLWPTNSADDFRAGMIELSRGGEWLSGCVN
jgi:hypothetical protein